MPTLNGAKPVTSYMVSSTAAFSATVGTAAGSAVGSAVASTVGSAATATPFAIAACFSAALIASLVSVTPLFTSTCAVARSSPTSAESASSVSISAPKPGVSLLFGALTEAILPPSFTSTYSVNLFMPFTVYGSPATAGAASAPPRSAAACFSASLMALLVSVAPLFTSICAVAMS